MYYSCLVVTFFKYSSHICIHYTSQKNIKSAKFFLLCLYFQQFYKYYIDVNGSTVLKNYFMQIWTIYMQKKKYFIAFNLDKNRLKKKTNCDVATHVQ